MTIDGITIGDFSRKARDDWEIKAYSDYIFKAVAYKLGDTSKINLKSMDKLSKWRVSDERKKLIWYCDFDNDGEMTEVELFEAFKKHNAQFY